MANWFWSVRQQRGQETTHQVSRVRADAAHRYSTTLRERERPSQATSSDNRRCRSLTSEEIVGDVVYRGQLTPVARVVQPFARFQAFPSRAHPGHEPVTRVSARALRGSCRRRGPLPLTAVRRQGSSSAFRELPSNRNSTNGHRVENHFAQANRSGEQEPPPLPHWPPRRVSPSRGRVKLV